MASGGPPEVVFAAPGSVAPPTSIEDDVKRRASKKLQKKRKEERAMELPERLKGGDDSSEEEVVAPNPTNMFMHMNQSIFGLIAAASSQVNFDDRFEGQSSDESDADGDDSTESSKPGSTDHSARNISKTTVFKKSSTDGKEGWHRRKLSERKLLKSLPALPRLSLSRSKKEPTKLPSQAEEPSETSETTGSPSIEVTGEDNRLAPVMSRMLEARAEMSSRPSFDLDRLSGEKGREEDTDDGPGLLAKKLMEIFEFEQPETVIEGDLDLWLSYMRAVLTVE